MNNPLTSKKYELTPTGIVWSDTPLSFTEWSRLGETLRTMHGAVQWWVGDWLLFGEGTFAERASQALETTGWSENTLTCYASVCRRVPLENRREDVPFGHYANGLAALPLPQQQAWADRIHAENLSQAELKTQLRLSARKAHRVSNPLPYGLFRVLYADPPWRYDDSGVITASDGAAESYGKAERHYPTMSMDELCALDVVSRCEPDAVLFCWVTAPLLLQTPGPREMIEAWGFTPKTNMVWDKQRHNYGHYVSVQHEHLIIATRGSCTPDELTPMISSVQRIRPSDVHSEKPVEFRRIIERLYPVGAKLEFFGREPVEGWTVYGNDLAVPVSESDATQAGEGERQPAAGDSQGADA